MVTNVNLHFYRAPKEEPFGVEGRVQRLADDSVKSAYIKLSLGNCKVSLFFDNIEDMERVEFELSTLIMEAREAWNGNRVISEGE